MTQKRHSVFAAALAVLALMLQAAPAHAQTAPTTCAASENFSADADVQRVSAAYAQDAVDVAQRNFHVTLDWSDASVDSVEQILGVLHDERASAPSDDVIDSFAKMFGSYVGEVYRRNHGAAWGMVTLQGDAFPGMQREGSCTLFWPWGRARNRIDNGAENNIADYYQALVSGDVRDETGH